MAYPNPKSKSPRLNFERKIFLLTILAGLPGVMATGILLWTGDYTAQFRWTLWVLLVFTWLGIAFRLREKVVFPLQTLSNLLAALREEDYSIRARGAGFNDALAEVMHEVNALGESLRLQRMGAVDATTLLRSVMAEIDVAVFTFDANQNLRLVNRAGERLLAATAEQLTGRPADSLGLEDCLQGEEATTLSKVFPGGSGRWAIRRSTFREGGVPHQLLLLTDLSRALREEERLAWQRLVRVLGHELNNSLTPIKSIAGSLEQLIRQKPPPGDWEVDMRRGLEVIATRAEALSRFMQAYTRLARLPQPQFRPVDVGTWIRTVIPLETRLAVKLQPGPELEIKGDKDQLEQLLINLIRNAVDASLETGGTVALGWKKLPGQLEVWVADEGPGLSETSNLFVPFFTTKLGGSGIGLVLSRQIAEAHAGQLTLEDRKEAKGCVAHLRLPA